jgi:hypothetical protein
MSFNRVFKPFQLWCCFALFNQPCFGQVVSGYVLDATNHDTISYASVFFEGTFKGTNTDAHGYFTIDLAGKPFTPLTVSAIGYYTNAITEYSPARPVTVYLSPKVYAFKEVVVNAQGSKKQRKRDLRIFREVFLGTTPNALRCIILNENDVAFNIGSHSDTLRAFVYNPITVRNPNLGYTVTYYLDKFEFNRKTTDYYIKGVISFKEDLVNAGNRNQVEHRRYRAYNGSIPHFFKSLWNGNLEDFTVTDKNWNEFQLTDSVSVNDSVTRLLNCKTTFYVRHNRMISKAIPINNKLTFDKYGFYVPDIKWQGDMASRRIGDWLPVEYYADK